MRIDGLAARRLFDRLPAQLRLASLSPEYVEADAARSQELEPAFWVHEEADRFWYHGFHLMTLPGIDGFDIQSPSGYGGPLANSCDAAFLARAWQSYQQWAVAAQVAAEFVRFHPLADNARFYGGRIEMNRHTVWVDLTVPDLLGSYEPRVRTAIRKALRAGVDFHWLDSGEIASRFAAYYRAGMAVIGAAPSYLFCDPYFRAMAQWPAVRLGVCALEGEWLAAGLFLRGGDGLEYHLAASSEAGKRRGAGNLLLHGAAASAKGDGSTRFYLGGGTDSDPKNSLYVFKSGHSVNRADFTIGTCRHDAQRYRLLEDLWPDRRRENAGRLLFYR